MKISGILRVSMLEAIAPMPYEKLNERTVRVTLRDAVTGVTAYITVTPEDAREIHLGDELPYTVGT